MSTAPITFWIDKDNNVLLSGWNSNSVSPTPVFKQGDNFGLEMHIIERADGSFTEVPLNGVSFKLAIGNPDAFPTSGSWILAYGSSQVEFDFDETSESVESALNLIPEIITDGGVTVAIVNGSTYRITFNNKVAISSTFTTDSSNLIPSSYSTVSQIKTGSATTRAVWHIKLKQVPVAYQPNWTIQPNASATLTSIGNNTHRLSITPVPKDGTFSIEYTEVTVNSLGVPTTNTLTTQAIPIGATETMVRDAFRAAANRQPYSTLVGLSNAISVKKVGSFSWDITSNTQTIGSSTITVTPTAVDGSGLISYESVFGNISLNNYETSSLLAGATSVVTTLEVEMTSGTSVSTILQTSCTIVADLIGQSVYAPTPFDDPISQSDVDASISTALAGLGDLANVDDAPSDGSLYARQDGAWVAFQEEDNQGITQGDADARYLQQSNNLSEIDNVVTARDNLDVYSTGEIDTALNSKADIFGDTFTGKVNFTPVNGQAGLNIGVGGTNTSATSAGDLWIATGGTNLNFRDGTGAWRVLATQGQTNTFSTNQIVSGSTTTAMLRVTQTGTGEALRVEDETNPDSTPFVVGADGRVGIHGTPANNTAHKLAIYNGNIVFSLGYGLAFGDGTVQTTASTFNPVGYATESWVLAKGYLTTSDFPIIQIINSGHFDYRQAPTDIYDISYFDAYAQENATMTIGITAPVGWTYHLWTVRFTNNLPLGTVEFDSPNKVLRLGVFSETATLQDAVSTYTGSGTATPSGWTIVFSGSGSPYAPSTALASDSVLYLPVITLNSGAGAVILNGGVIADLRNDAVNNQEYNKVLETDEYGNVSWGSKPNLANYVLRTGDTFTGRLGTTATATSAPLNIAVSTTAPSSTFAGDIWVGTNNIFFKDSTNTQRALVNQNTQNTFTTNQIISGTSALPMLRVTQTGTGHSLVVEDATNPDSTSFIVANNGSVAIGRDPSTYTPSNNVLLDVGGRATFTPSTTLAGINVGTVTTTPTSLTNGDIWIGNALNFRDQTGQNRSCVVTNTSNTISSATSVNPILTVSQTGTTAGVGAVVITNTAPSTALRITQTGAGHALVVEDATNPDITSTVIDQNGNVGIGINPATWTATDKLEVNGGIKFLGNSTVQTTAYIPSNVAITGGTINNIVIDGGTY